MRCGYLEKHLFPGQDNKMHNHYYCKNFESKNYMRYSVDNCSVCGNCLDHCTNPDTNIDINMSVGEALKVVSDRLNNQ